MEEQKVNQTPASEAVNTKPEYHNKPVFKKSGTSRLQHHINRGMTAFLVVMLCLFVYFALLRIDSIASAIRTILGALKPIIYGIAIAYVLNPVVMGVDKFLSPRLESRIKNHQKARSASRAIGIAAAIILLITLIVGLFNLMIPELYKSIRNLAYSLPDQLNHLVEVVNNYSKSDSTTATFIKEALEQGSEALTNWLKTDLMGKLNSLMSNLTVGVVAAVKELFNFVIGVMVSAYLLFGKETFLAQSKKGVYAFLKKDSANMALHICSKTNEMFGGFIIGKVVDSLIIGLICFICLIILQMPYALLVSVIVGVTNVIPFFGPYIGAIPSAILILLESPMKGLIFIVFIVVLQQIDGNIIGPKILGDKTGLSSFWVIFAILLGGNLFGIIGMIVGVPTFAVIYYIIEMITTHKLEEKELPTDTKVYGEDSYVGADGKLVEDPVER